MSLTLKTETISKTPVSEVWEADEADRIAIADRLGLPALHRFVARFDIKRDGMSGLIGVTGHIEADFSQICVISLEEFETDVVSDIDVEYDDDAVRVARHIEAAKQGGESHGDDIPAGFDDLPEPVINGEIDLLELAIQQLSLAMDPHPRAPGVNYEDEDDGSDGEDEPSGPFSALAKLKQ